MLQTLMGQVKNPELFLCQIDQTIPMGIYSVCFYFTLLSLSSRGS